MSSPLNRVLGDPLLHFGLLAVVVFALDGWPRRTDVEASVVDVSADYVRWLADSHGRRRGRELGRAEIQAHVEEELLVREARRLGLADGDPIVRRRIAQKMRFMFEDAAVERPSVEALQAHLEANADRYRAPAAARVSQIFMGAERPSPAQMHDLRRLLIADPDAVVGRPLAMGRDLGLVGRAALERLFSESVAARVDAARVKTWIGPFESRFGHHLLRVEARRPAHLPRLATIRSRVEADLRNVRRERAVASEIARIRARYVARVEWPSEGAAPVAAARDRQ